MADTPERRETIERIWGEIERLKGEAKNCERRAEVLMKAREENLQQFNAENEPATRAERLERRTRRSPNLSVYNDSRTTVHQFRRSAEKILSSIPHLEAHYYTEVFAMWCVNREGGFPNVHQPLKGDPAYGNYHWTTLNSFKVQFEVVDDWEAWKDNGITCEYNEPNDLPHAAAVGQGQDDNEFRKLWKLASHNKAREEDVDRFWHCFFKSFESAAGISGGQKDKLHLNEKQEVTPDAYYYRSSSQPHRQGHENRTQAVCVEVKTLSAANKRSGIANAVTQTLVQCVAAAASNPPQDGGEAQVVGKTIVGTEVFIFQKYTIPSELVQHVKRNKVSVRNMPPYSGRPVKGLLYFWKPPVAQGDSPDGRDTARDFTNAEQTLSLSSHLDTPLREMQHDAAPRNNNR